MRIFVSWSGDRSRRVAEKLRSWLPSVLPDVTCFVSSEDISKGQRWNSTLTSELRSSDFGIVVVTRENSSSLWLHFEAGALANRFDHAAVCPLLIDIAPSDLVAPLSQFQCTTMEPDDLRRLISSINGACSQPVNRKHLDDIFDIYSPNFIRDVAEIAAMQGGNYDQRDTCASISKEFLNENYVMNSENFQSAMARCRDLRILGFTQNRMLATYSGEVKNICLRGGSIKVLVLSPDCNAVLLANERSYVPKTTDSIRHQHKAALAMLESIAASSEAGAVAVKGIEIIPPFTLFIFGFEDKSEDECYVWMMPWKQPSRSRPGFRLRRSTDEKWMRFFEGQFETIWGWDRASLLINAVEGSV